MLNYLVTIVPTDGRASTDRVLTNLGSRKYRQHAFERSSLQKRLGDHYINLV